MTEFNKQLAHSFIKRGVKVCKVICHNEEKPCKIQSEILEEDGQIYMEVYNGRAIWKEDKWEFVSNFALLSEVIMNRNRK